MEQTVFRDNQINIESNQIKNIKHKMFVVDSDPFNVESNLYKAAEELSSVKLRKQKTN